MSKRGAQRRGPSAPAAPPPDPADQASATKAPEPPQAAPEPKPEAKEPETMDEGNTADLRPNNGPNPPVNGAGDPGVGGLPPMPARRKLVHPYEVAPGKAITTVRGTRADGEDVTERDFLHGAETLKDLVAKGYVLDNTEALAAAKGDDGDA